MCDALIGHRINLQPKPYMYQPVGIRVSWLFWIKQYSAKKEDR